MRVAFVVLLALHGAIHLLGFVKAFGLAEVAQLTRPIPRRVGALWLASALGFFATAVLFVVAPRDYWMVGAPTLVLSQGLVLLAWRDARFGTVANVLVLVPLALTMLDLRPSSLRSRYEREVEAGLARTATHAPITEADLAPLPDAVQTYLRRVGVVGRPRPRGFRAHFRAQMKSAEEAPWMDAQVEQYNFFDRTSRIFFMEASRAGVPFDVFHLYRGAHATMEVRIAGLYPMVDARGPQMDQSETVTLLNDMCLMAPGSLVGAAITWEERTPREVRATFTNAGHTVHADLTFDAAGDLRGFVSRDRFLSADGLSYRALPWSTPVTAYGRFHGLRLMQRGDARWRAPEGDWTYGRFETMDVVMIPASE